MSFVKRNCERGVNEGSGCHYHNQEAPWSFWKKIVGSLPKKKAASRPGKRLFVLFTKVYFWKHPLPGKDTKNFLAFSPAALRVQYLFSDAPLKTKPILQKFFGCPFCFQKYRLRNTQEPFSQAESQGREQGG